MLLSETPSLPPPSLSHTYTHILSLFLSSYGSIAYRFNHLHRRYSTAVVNYDLLRAAHERHRFDQSTGRVARGCAKIEILCYAAINANLRATSARYSCCYDVVFSREMRQSCVIDLNDSRNG